MNMKANQNGVSLIEILISITMSLFLMAGVLQVLVNSKQAYRIGAAFGELQENSRFISSYLPSIIRMSGYRTPPADTMFSTLEEVFPANLPHILVVNNLGVNGSDIISIRYQGSGDSAGTPDGTIRDCLNQGIDGNTVVLNVFSINANNELECQVLNPNAATPVSTQMLIPGVENLQVLYGEDTNGDRIADRYIPPNFAGLITNNIVSVRMSILVASTQEVYKAIDNNTYNLLGTTYTPTPDYRIRKSFDFTIHLRNLTSIL